MAEWAGVRQACQRNCGDSSGVAPAPASDGGVKGEPGHRSSFLTRVLTRLNSLLDQPFQAKSRSSFGRQSTSPPQVGSSVLRRHSRHEITAQSGPYTAWVALDGPDGAECGRAQVCMKSEPSTRPLPHRQPLVTTLMQHYQSSSLDATIIVYLKWWQRSGYLGNFQEAPQCARRVRPMPWRGQ